MAFLKRMSGSLWSYVSPAKSETPNNAPQTLPKFKKTAAPTKRRSLDDVVKRSRSMSPTKRVSSWRMRSPSEESSFAPGSKKRKRLFTPSTSAGAGAGRWHRKFLKMEDDDVDYTSEIDDDSDVIMNGNEADDDKMEEVSTNLSNIRVRHTKSPSPKGYAIEYEDETEIDSSLVVSEEEYSRTTPKRKMLISPTTEHFARGVSTEELRAQGWDDDHIVLVQEIAMRGFKPLMPQYWHFEYRFHMPDSLFAPHGADDTAMIRSVRQDHFRATKALEKLLELGGWVRDRVFLKGRVRPEHQVRRTMDTYMKWAEEDSGLDRKTVIPILAIVTASADVDADEIKENARRRLARLAARYKEAFRVLQSIENSPGSRTSTVLSYPVPTLYAIIASHTLIALTAYNPEDATPDVKSVAFFDMKDKDYDVWNAFALAIVVCHVRNVQMRIAEETGLGLKSARQYESEPEDDPDL